MTPTEINALHAEFWAMQVRLVEKRMGDTRIGTVALTRLARDQRRGVPVYFQKTLELHLEETAEDLAVFLKETARAAGRAPRKDALNEIIEELLRSNPEITTAHLRHLLTREQYPGVIIDVAEAEISYQQGDRLKVIPVAALKHRLSRHRKKVRLR